MIEGFSVTPAGLRLAGGRVRSSGRQLAAAGRTACQALELAPAPGSLASVAALGLAAAIGVRVALLSASVEALAQALDAAADRYASIDALLASVARQ